MGKYGVMQIQDLLAASQMLCGVKYTFWTDQKPSRLEGMGY